MVTRWLNGLHLGRTNSFHDAKRGALQLIDAEAHVLDGPQWLAEQMIGFEPAEQRIKQSLPATNDQVWAAHVLGERQRAAQPQNPVSL